MLLLAIETSCDETAAAVVRDGYEVLSSVVSSQVAIHAEYGGVVPEIASRKHLEMICPVISQALEEAGFGMSD
ncbi:MAG: tRNA (adenosine(37)-N6)-threonylcarbamoyltransferase complex transferase subunit TsaD, partial [Deltaproteobacteria bacterium]